MVVAVTGLPSEQVTSSAIWNVTTLSATSQEVARPDTIVPSGEDRTSGS